MARPVKVTGQLKNLIGRFTKALGQKYGHERFLRAKKFILDEVRKHPICKELSSHSRSKFLPNSDGTLFGFMGFPVGSDPVDNLLSFLEANIEENNVFILGVLLNITKIRLPSFDQMANEPSLQVPWMVGISWPQMIEDGVSGLQHFLRFPDKKNNVPDNSVSQEGLQSKTRVRTQDMPPVPFLTPIFQTAFSA